MSKDTPFFKFDSESWLSGSIQYCSLEEKGFFIDLCAHYWGKQKPIRIDKKFKVRYRHLKDNLEVLVDVLSDLDLIVNSEAGITVPFLDRLMDDRNTWLKKCSDSGKKSHNSRRTSSNKKEDSRKKKEDIREKKEDKNARDKLLKLIEPYKKRYPMPEDEYKKFVGWWLAVNDMNETPRFENDRYFKADTKLASWYGRWKKDIPEESKVQKMLRELNEETNGSE